MSDQNRLLALLPPPRDPQGLDQNLLSTIQQVAKLGTYTPGARASVNVEDRRPHERMRQMIEEAGLGGRFNWGQGINAAQGAQEPPSAWPAATASLVVQP